MYTDGGRRTRLLRRRPYREPFPTGEVDGLGFSRKAGGNTLYTVTFTHNGVSHRHGHHISEIVRVEETEIAAGNGVRHRRP